MANIIKKLLGTGLIDDLDFQFAQFTGRIEKTVFSSDEFEILLVSAALISRQINCGHICLAQNDVENLRNETEKEIEMIPQWTDIINVMSKSSSCSDGKTPAPVVFDGARLYLYRYWQYENRLAKRIIEMSKDAGRYIEKYQELAETITLLFGEEGKTNGQLEAALSAVRNRFSVITGGPGTGKTTAIAKILAAVFTSFPDESVVLAAPTGKAASRMNEALKNAVSFTGNSINDEIKLKIQELNGCSIHRLLGWTRTPGVFVHNNENPIDAGIVIIDEASMIDLSLMSKLVDSIHSGTSLLLLGDKDQLTSVEAGNVLGDICEASLKGVFKEKSVSVLTKSYRFGKSAFIGELASKVNRGENIAVIKEVFEKCNDGSIKFIDSKISSSMEVIEEAIIRNYSSLFKNSSALEVIAALEKFRILCASKVGNGGVFNINRFAESVMIKNGLIRSPGELWYHGRPVMVTENNYVLELFNGDCGVILEKEGEKRGCFQSNDGTVRSFPVSMLPSVETVYAMTVHKSQGSEYDSVMVILPEKEMAVLTKELIYTAVTRSRKDLTIIGKEEILSTAVKRSAARNSGLADALIFLSKQ
ncbi:MAG TPA: exodeoxyribonuclease V subunit alpha [bacterium]|nr:exodeoxyribonuclease V subunit alpha [bacterium]